jgi:hypothetical protein
VTGGVHERGKQNAESGTRFLAAGDFDADLFSGNGLFAETSGKESANDYNSTQKN